MAIVGIIFKHDTVRKRKVFLFSDHSRNFFALCKTIETFSFLVSILEHIPTKFFGSMASMTLENSLAVKWSNW
jgi:hypothetical protein